MSSASCQTYPVIRIIHRQGKLLKENCSSIFFLSTFRSKGLSWQDVQSRQSDSNDKDKGGTDWNSIQKKLHEEKENYATISPQRVQDGSNSRQKEDSDSGGTLNPLKVKDDSSNQFREEEEEKSTERSKELESLRATMDEETKEGEDSDIDLKPFRNIFQENVLSTLSDRYEFLFKTFTRKLLLKYCLEQYRKMEHMMTKKACNYHKLHQRHSRSMVSTSIKGWIQVNVKKMKSS